MRSWMREGLFGLISSFLERDGSLLFTISFSLSLLLSAPRLSSRRLEGKLGSVIKGKK